MLTSDNMFRYVTWYVQLAITSFNKRTCSRSSPFKQKSVRTWGSPHRTAPHHREPEQGPKFCWGQNPKASIANINLQNTLCRNLIPVSCKGALIEDLNEHLSAGLPSVWDPKTILTAVLWFLTLYTEFPLLWKWYVPNASHVSEVQCSQLCRIDQNRTMTQSYTMECHAVRLSGNAVAMQWQCRQRILRRMKRAKSQAAQARSQVDARMTATSVANHRCRRQRGEVVAAPGQRVAPHKAQRKDIQRPSKTQRLSMQRLA